MVNKDVYILEQLRINKSVVIQWAFYFTILQGKGTTFH